MTSHLYFFNGTDPAPSDGQNSDDGATVVGAAEPRNVPEEGEALSQHAVDWRFSLVYARRLTVKHKASARQWSGLLHHLESRFRFEKMVMDPGGGGTLVKREMIAPVQLIHGTETACTPIGDQVDGPKLAADAKYILHMWKRGDPGVELLCPDGGVVQEISRTGEVRSKWKSEAALNQQLYVGLKDGLDAGVIDLPADIGQLWATQPDLVGAFDEERLWSLKNLDAFTKQAVDIFVKMLADGETHELSRDQCKLFSSNVKKDLVSAAMYCYAGFLMWLQAGEFMASEDGEGGGFDGW